MEGLFNERLQVRTRQLQQQVALLSKQLADLKEENTKLQRAELEASKKVQLLQEQFKGERDRCHRLSASLSSCRASSAPTVNRKSAGRVHVSGELANAAGVCGISPAAALVGTWVVRGRGRGPGRPRGRPTYGIAPPSPRHQVCAICSRSLVDGCAVPGVSLAADVAAQGLAMRGYYVKAHQPGAPQMTTCAGPRNDVATPTRPRKNIPAHRQDILLEAENERLRSALLAVRRAEAQSLEAKLQELLREYLGGNILPPDDAVVSWRNPVQFLDSCSSLRTEPPSLICRPLQADAGNNGHAHSHIDVINNDDDHRDHSEHNHDDHDHGQYQQRSLMLDHNSAPNGKKRQLPLAPLLANVDLQDLPKTLARELIVLREENLWLRQKLEH